MADLADDYQLLQAYLSGSQQAFTELADRHAPLVYSAALRQTRDPHMADDITQAVFLLLSQKARRLSRSTILSAWLYRTTRFAARDAMKKQRRRQHHESIAAVSPTTAVEVEQWTDIAPMLDDAMHHLREKDRTAILLRYFENKTLRDVSAILGTTEAAAGQRISRAIDRLRTFFSRHNITIPAATLSSALARRAIVPTPFHVLAPTLASPTAVTIAKGAAAMMFWTKAKIALIAAVLMVAIAVPPLLLDARAQTQTTLHPAAPKPGQPIHVDFPGGVSIELPCLVGTGTGADADKTWAPDGTILNPPPIQVAVDEKGIKGIHLSPGQRIVQMPLQGTDRNGGDLYYFIMAGNEEGICGQAMRDGKSIKNSRVWGEKFNSTETTHWVLIHLELDAWQLLATWDSHAKDTDVTTDDTHFDVEAAVPAVRDGELVVSLTVAYDTLVWDSRMFAVLKDGTRRQADHGFNRRLANTNVMRWSFPADKPLNPDNVVRYELEVTPLTEVMLNNISLFPGQHTQPSIKVTPPPALFKLKPSFNQPGGL